jgi:NAD-dependent SIR2 family protein deacetylase
MDGKIVLFAGAGISTEAKGVMPNTFYNGIKHVLGDTDPNRSFPDVMQEFCSTPSGKIGLIQRIKDHFDYAYDHLSIYQNATRFHRELSTFFPIDTIVTTNWDIYFEDICAATPFIEDRDISLWEVADRKVLKLHGSIANFGSIVATKSDYDLCKIRMENGVLGAHLKSLLATRSTVFVGYSLRDDDFLQIYESVRGGLNDFHRQAYFRH